jgi:hypothetical protein
MCERKRVFGRESICLKKREPVIKRVSERVIMKGLIRKITIEREGV